MVYDVDGKFIQKEVEIKVSELPKNMTDEVTRTMGGKKISEASKIISADNSVSYEVEVGEEDFIFDGNGRLMGQEEENEEDAED